MSNNAVVIKQVWKDNFDAEMSIIKEKAIINHRFISLTTRLLLCRERVPVGIAWGDSSANYSSLLEKTNMFKNIVQVGVALCDKLGRLPRCGETGRPRIWEFNLMRLDEAPIYPYTEKDCLEKQFLEQFCGNVNADQLRSQGIHPARFAAELRRCSLLLNDQISWVVFKGGLDLMALIRLWETQGVEDLTLERKEFFSLLALYFPVFYDMAAVMGFHPLYDHDGTIEASAQAINVWREDEPPHGAASDSLLALRMFIRMKMLKRRPDLLEKKARVLFGVTSEREANAVPTYYMAPVPRLCSLYQ